MDLPSTSSGYIAEVDDKIKPMLNYCFDTIEEAEKFYNEYARAAGFSVRKSTTKHKDKILISKLTFVVNKGKEISMTKGEHKMRPERESEHILGLVARR